MRPGIFVMAILVSSGSCSRRNGPGYIRIQGAGVPGMSSVGASLAAQRK
jgi:hypothetical protein